MPDDSTTRNMETGSKDFSSKPPDIVVTNKALKVAQAWVKNMTGGTDSDPEEDDTTTKAGEEFGGLRPARLGLGAKYLPHSAAAALLSPVERKLRAKLIGSRQGDPEKFTWAHRKETTTTTREADSDGDEDEDENDEGKHSKTSAFGRKQRNTSTNLLMPTSKADKKAGKRKR